MRKWQRALSGNSEDSMRVPKIAVLALYGVSLAATTWQVSTNGADNPACGTSASPCQTIQFTIDNRAASGDRIVIAAGVYQEHLTIPINLTLSGAGTADTLIDGTLTGPVVTISGNRSVTLNQLTVQRGLNLRCEADRQPWQADPGANVRERQSRHGCGCPSRIGRRHLQPGVHGRHSQHHRAQCRPRRRRHL